MKIIVKRVLNDYDTWKQMVMSFDGLRTKYGSRGGTAYRSAKEPNTVYLVFDWDDDKPYQEYFDLPEVQTAISNSGTFELIECSESFALEE